MKRLPIHIQAACLLMAILFTLCCGAAAEGSTGILYRVTGGKNDLALLGSIHIGNEAMYPVGSHIQDALDAADTMVFECDTESVAAVEAMLDMMYYPTGDSLRAHVSDECYELLKQAAQKTGYRMEALNMLKPWGGFRACLLWKVPMRCWARWISTRLWSWGWKPRLTR